MKLSVVIVVTAAISGCAFRPCEMSASCPTTETEKTTNIAQERLFAYQKSEEGFAKLIVTRDVGAYNGGCYTMFYINGELAGRFDPGERAIFYVPAGRIEFQHGSDKLGRGLCSIANNKMSKNRSIALEGGKEVKLRLSLPEAEVFDVQLAW